MNSFREPRLEHRAKSWSRGDGAARYSGGDMTVSHKASPHRERSEKRWYRESFSPFADVVSDKGIFLFYRLKYDSYTRKEIRS